MDTRELLATCGESTFQTVVVPPSMAPRNTLYAESSCVHRPVSVDAIDRRCKSKRELRDAESARCSRGHSSSGSGPRRSDSSHLVAPRKSPCRSTARAAGTARAPRRPSVCAGAPRGTRRLRCARPDLRARPTRSCRTSPCAPRPSPPPSRLLGSPGSIASRRASHYVQGAPRGRAPRRSAMSRLGIPRMSGRRPPRAQISGARSASRRAGSEGGTACTPS